MTVRLLAFSGSSRKGSYNTALLGVVAKAATDAGVEVNTIDLRALDLPIFDEDLESDKGLPAGCLTLKDAMKEAHGFLIASPEYNSTFSPLLKNAIDWASRPREGEGPLECFRGKVAGLVSASPGYYGGYRGLQQVRYVLGNIGAVVMPDMFALPKSHEAFADDGSLKDARQAEMAAGIATTLIDHIKPRVG